MCRPMQHMQCKLSRLMLSGLHLGFTVECLHQAQTSSAAEPCQATLYILGQPDTQAGRLPKPCIPVAY